MRKALKRIGKSKRGYSWEKILGYTVQQLRQHLDTTMPGGFTWEHFVTGELHIDHRTPVCMFKFESTEDENFKRCFALSNLQLLPALANMQKGGRFAEPPIASFF